MKRFDYSDNWRGAWLALLVAVVLFAVYSPSIGYDFVALDDDVFVSENPVVKDGFSEAALKAAWTTAPENYWAPLLWMSFMLDVELFGPEPWGFHLTNVFLFSLNVGLLFWLVRRWTGRTRIALAVALLWALHPSRVESVAWITERKDVLSGLFFLLGVGAYVEARKGGLKHGVVIAWLCLVFGGMVKQVLIVMPAALMLLDIWPLERTCLNRIWRDGWRSGVEKWAFWTVALVLACLPIWFHHDGGSMLDVSIGHRLAMIPSVCPFCITSNDVSPRSRAVINFDAWLPIPCPPLITFSAAIWRICFCTSSGTAPVIISLACPAILPTSSSNISELCCVEADIPAKSEAAAALCSVYFSTAKGSGTAVFILSTVAVTIAINYLQTDGMSTLLPPPELDDSVSVTCVLTAL